METARSAIPISDSDLDALKSTAEKHLTHINGGSDLEQILKALAPEETYRTTPLELEMVYTIRHATCLYIWACKWLFSHTGQEQEAARSDLPTDSIRNKQKFSSAYALFVMANAITDDCHDLIKSKDNLATLKPNFRFNVGSNFSQDLQLIFSYYVDALQADDGNGVKLVKNSIDVVAITRDFWEVVAAKALDECKRAEPEIQAVVANTTFKNNDFVITGFTIEKQADKKTISFVPVQPEEIVGNTEAVIMLLRLCDRLALYDPELKKNPLCEIGGLYESNLLDGPPGCVTGDTKILLLDGTSIPIKDLVEKSNFWVYSYDLKNNCMAPGLAVGVARTGINKHIVKVQLTTKTKIKGRYVSEITCTSDHPFLLTNGEYKQAQHLKAGDSIRSIYFWVDHSGYYEGYKTYTTNHGILDKRAVHKQIGYYEYKRETTDKEDCHHINEIKLDNRPNNLIYISNKDHSAIHGKEGWQGSEGEKWKLRERSKFVSFNKDPLIREKQYAGKERSGHWDRVRNRISEYNTTAHPNLRNDITIELLISLAKDAKSMKQFFNLVNCSRTKARTTILKAGYTEPEFRRLFINRVTTDSTINHKIINVVDCGTADVFDLTVDNYHNFAIDDGQGNGIFTHNTGKTTLQRMALTRLASRADQVNLPYLFRSLEAKDIKSEWYGKSGKMLADIIEAITADSTIALLLVDDIDLLLSNRDDPGTGGADRDLLKGLMDFFSGVGTNYRGNYSSIAATNKPTGVDDALRQRFVYRVMVTGAETWEDYADLVALQLKKPLKYGLVTIADNGYKPLQRVRSKTVLGQKKMYNKAGAWTDIGHCIMELHSKNPSFTARSVKNSMDVVIAKAGDFEIPDNWFTDSTVFLKQPWDTRVAMVKSLFGVISTDAIINSLTEQAESEVRYNEMKYVNKKS